MAFPLFRAVSVNSESSFTSPTISAPLPTNTTVNDGMIIHYGSAFLAGGGAPPTHTTPSGWTAIATGTYNNGVLESRVTFYTRIAQAGDGAVTLTSSANAAHVFQRLSYYAPDIANWFSGITVLTGLTASSVNHTMPSVTTTKRRQMVLYFLGNTLTSTTFADASASLTERQDSFSSATYEFEALAVGAVGTKQIDTSSADQVFYGVVVLNGMDSIALPSPGKRMSNFIAL